MPKTIVLIDYESVQPESLLGLDLPHWHCMVFVGAGQTKVSLTLAMAMQRMGARAQYVQMTGQGPNALDFHIAFYLGQLAAADSAAVFHVVSKDKGFDPLIQHLQSLNIAVLRTANLSAVPSEGVMPLADDPVGKANPLAASSAQASQCAA